MQLQKKKKKKKLLPPTPRSAWDKFFPIQYSGKNIDWPTFYSERFETPSRESHKAMPGLLAHRNCEKINKHLFKPLCWLKFLHSSRKPIHLLYRYMDVPLSIDWVMSFWAKGQVESWINKIPCFVKCYNHWFKVLFLLYLFGYFLLTIILTHILLPPMSNHLNEFDVYLFLLDFYFWQLCMCIWNFPRCNWGIDLTISS